MLVRRFLATTFLSFLLMGPFISTKGAPTVSFSSPVNNSVQLTQTVEVTGVASGSNGTWFQTSAADFNAGTSDHIVVDPSGSLSLATGIYDDFNDNSFDTTKWSIMYEQNGLTITETGGELKLSGTTTDSNYWTGAAEIISTSYMSNNISADLTSFSGSGTGYGSGLAMYQDSLNSASIGLTCDQGYWGSNPQILFSTNSGGVGTMQSLGAATSNSYNFRISSISGTVYVYMDNVLIASADLVLSNCYFILDAGARVPNDQVTAYWDNVKGSIIESADYTSSVYDTLSVDPVLKRANWTADTPSGTGVDVYVRSSGSPDMSSATSWARVTNGQTSSLPSVKRYLQYKVTLTSPGGTNTPVFKDITLTYTKPVKKVELSADEQATWTAAVGTTKWNATLNLPEGANRIWVRATDVAGDTALASITVFVDITPPTGTITINDGNLYTGERNVSVRLNATDMFGVPSVILSEYDDFGDTSWTGFQSTIQFELSEGTGEKTVYAKFRDANGRESDIVNDTIFLDEEPPVGSIVINDGAEFTRDPEVSLNLTATDISGVKDVMVSNTADFAAAGWSPFTTSLNWTLLSGNGERTVYAKFRDLVSQESKAYSDKILLDTTAPSVNVSINSGNIYTRSTTVSLGIDATDNYRVESMVVSQSPDFTDASWQPLQATMDYTLPSGDGLKTVYVKVEDVAGNVGFPQTASITLDQLAPVTTLNSIPREVDDRNITIGWSGADATSGVDTYDVQYRDGTGLWTDWLLKTNATGAIFIGQEGHNYSFRARARDRAGNEAGFPNTVDNSVYVWPKYKPEVSISYPGAMSTVKGSITISGTAHHPDPRRSIVHVFVSLDDGPWNSVNGTMNWKMRLDTTRLDDGPHTVKAQAYDGERYSNTTTVNFAVRNPGPEPTLAVMSLVFIIVGAVIAAVVGVFIFMSRRKSDGGAGMPPAQISPPLAVAPLLRPAPPRPVPPAPEKMTVVQKISVEDLNEPEEAPAREPPHRTASEMKAYEMDSRETRILHALSSLPRGLPSSLWGIDMEDLAAKVASAERKESPDGDKLIKIKTRWYYGDETDLGRFLQEYKK